MADYAKQDPFQQQQHQHQSAPQYHDTQQSGGHGYHDQQQQQYTSQQQYQGYQPPTPAPGALTHQNTMASIHSGIQPVLVQPHIQPDPLPKALTQAQVSAVTAQQAAAMYPGATLGYVPRLTAPDEFHHTLCGCCGDFFTCKNMSTCCCGTWCPCILASRIHYRLRARNPQDLNGFSGCNGQCWGSCCFGMGVHMRQRDELRHRYRLGGSCCGDCMRHWCCGPCALCQEEKEVVYREEELEMLIRSGAYQGQQGGMVYPTGKMVQ